MGIRSIVLLANIFVATSFVKSTDATNRGHCKCQFLPEKGVEYYGNHCAHGYKPSHHLKVVQHGYIRCKCGCTTNWRKQRLLRLRNRANRNIKTRLTRIH